MSGGVDSSVAASLLRDAGHEVVGVFMRMSVEAPVSPGTGVPGLCGTDPSTAPKRATLRTCCSAADAADARAVALRLGIPFYVLDFTDPFERLIDHFVSEYNRGRTPNPCVLCNSELKFGRLFEYADAIDADAVATGHYARLVETPSGRRLARGRDSAKDQSYVLFGLSAAMWPRVVLPLGEWTKDRVRARAAQLGLPVADKTDSQEICFVPDDDYAALVARRSPQAVRPGRVLDSDGHEIGTHPGHQHYTIGQRRGLGIAAGSPLYVTAIDAAANTVTVGPADALLRRELTCSNVNWLIEPPSTSSSFQGEGWGKGRRRHPHPVPTRRDDPLPERARDSRNAPDTDLQAVVDARRAEVKIRYRAPAAAATLCPLGGGRVRVVFDEPVSAVTPGQAVVFYGDGGFVIGGGWID